jgi:hypothetical protein
VITAVATSPSGATASTHAALVFDFTPGTVVLDAGFEPDVRQSTRRAAGRRLGPRAWRDGGLHGGSVRNSELFDRNRRGPEPPAGNPGLRPTINYKDAAGNTLGTITISANSISRFITFSVPASSLGHPASGWGLFGGVDRPGRVQLQPGARLRGDSPGVPVRRVRSRRDVTHLQRESRERAQSG